VGLPTAFLAESRPPTSLSPSLLAAAATLDLRLWNSAARPGKPDQPEGEFAFRAGRIQGKRDSESREGPLTQLFEPARTPVPRSDFFVRGQVKNAAGFTGFKGATEFNGDHTIV
jgi:hypothetical protein